jgi:FkbM family methyltransferase
MKNKIYKILLSPILGKKKFQILFENLYKMSLLGMNMSGGSNYNDSGEKFTLDYINKKFKKNDNLILFDVGANIGGYSILLNKIFGAKSKVYSFEPSLNTFLKLKENTKNIPEIKIHNIGLGNNITKSSLFTNLDESGLSSLYKRRLNHFNIELNKKEEVDIKTIDLFCEENKINHINFLKLDVEGHENHVLQGATRMLKSGKIDYIQFEFGGCNIDSKTFFQDLYYLLKDDYKIYRILKDGLFPITQYKEIYEVFSTTNYLAEKISSKLK